MATTNQGALGAVVYFTTSAQILAAAKAATGKGFSNVESYTPFAIHGMDEALGLKPSIVPWATLVGGVMGFGLALHLQIWTSAYDWPLNVGGKPYISGPAFIPILFELTVLLAGLSTAFFMFAINGLPNYKPSPFSPRISDDLFALYIPFEGKNTPSEVETFLRSLHGENFSLVTEPV